ncbi:MAG: hypothetical protein V4616_11265 [Bacteroidota bacterium]
MTNRITHSLWVCITLIFQLFTFNLFSQSTFNCGTSHGSQVSLNKSAACAGIYRNHPLYSSGNAMYTVPTQQEEQFPELVVKVNFHYFQDDNGEGCFSIPIGETKEKVLADAEFAVKNFYTNIQPPSDRLLEQKNFERHVFVSRLPVFCIKIPISTPVTT